MGIDLNVLNAEQLDPVLQTEGAVLVTAGAGSGKTRLLTHRIAYLILDKGIEPYNILAITFTNKAAAQMRERLESIVPNSRGLWVSTFHSMCVRMLRKFGEEIGYTSNFSIYAEDEKERAIKRIIKENKFEDDSIKSVIRAISDAKSRGFDPDEYYKNYSYAENAELTRDVYVEYEIELKKNNALDFDDLLNKTYLLLTTSPAALKHYSERFKYIHVDEFQDTSVVQYKLVRLLAAKHKNVLVVGDEDQSIYSWRGACVTNIKDFIDDFDCKIYKLEQNYRSAKEILDLANKLIKQNTSRIDKTLWTEKSEKGEVDFYIAPTESREAEYVVNKISALVRYGGYSYSEIAILMRINALTRTFEEKLINYGIPYKVFGGFKFYERKEVKDILAYLRILVNKSDDDAIARVVNFPKRGIGDATVSQLFNYSRVKGISLYDAVMSIENNDDLPPNIVKKFLPFKAVLTALNEHAGTLKIFELVRFLIQLINLREAYAADTEENENRKQNIKELVNSIEQYEIQNPQATLEEYLQNVSLYSDLDEMNEGASCVNLATVHSAKGLEFKAVFIIGLEEGIFPITRSMDSSADLEEERRLMYVALTRAMSKLYLSNSESRFLYSERKRTLPSRFLDEIGFKPRQSQYVPYSSNNGAEYSKSKYYASQTTQFEPLKLQPVMPVYTKIDAEKFKTGIKVRHPKFGIGAITAVTGENENSYAEIQFETAGKLMLALNYAPLEVVE